MMKHDGTSPHRKIKCQFCHKIHCVPDDQPEGFLVDKHIPLLLNMKHSGEHDTAKKNFSEVKQLLVKLSKLDAEAYAIDFFGRVEADIVLEKETATTKLIAHYEKLVCDVRERKAKCLNNLSMNRTLGSQLESISRKLNEFDSKLKRDNTDFVLKTMDGDDQKWREVQSGCNTMLHKIKSLEEQLNKIVLGEEIIGFRPSARNTPIEDMCGQLDIKKFYSFIINSFKMENDLIELCNLSGKKFKLLYRASRDGFGASDFHGKCDNQPRTLTIVKTPNGCIFGGYTAVSWDSESIYKVDLAAFIFSLINPSSIPQLIPIREDDVYLRSIGCYDDFGPVFGGGHDFIISNNSNTSNESYSELSGSYDFQLDVTLMQAQSFLAGTRNFQTSEIEVFRVYKK